MTNLENNRCIQTVTWIATKFHRLFIAPVPTFRENFMQTVWKFLRKVAKKQTEKRQTNNDENITFLGGGKYVWTGNRTKAAVRLCAALK